MLHASLYAPKFLPQFSWNFNLSVTLNQISHLQILKLRKRETTVGPFTHFLDILLEMFKSIQEAYTHINANVQRRGTGTSEDDSSVPGDTTFLFERDVSV